MILFVIGMFVGAVIGVFSTAIAAVSKDKNNDEK